MSQGNSVAARLVERTLPCLQLVGCASAFAWVLACLPPADQPLVLGTLMLAETIARCLDLIAAGRPDAHWQDRLAYLLAAWIGLVLCAGTAMAADLLPFFLVQPFALLCLLGLSLILALLHFGTASSGRLSLFWRLLLSARLILLTALWQLVATTTSPIAEITLSLPLLGGLLLLLPLWRLPKGRAREEERDRAGWWQVADLLAVPFLLSGSEALTYLVARGIAHLPLSVIEGIERAAFPALAAALAKGNAGGFAALAARLNLGILLAGGAVALAVQSIAPLLPGPSALPLPSVLGWLLLGAVAPALFGATGVLLRAADLAPFLLAIRLTGAFAFATACLLLHVTSAAALAQIFAAVHLSTGFVAAVVLVHRVGIWPGITAVLLKRIRLL